jgi:hypothetical protein
MSANHWPLPLPPSFPFAAPKLAACSFCSAQQVPAPALDVVATDQTTVMHNNMVRRNGRHCRVGPAIHQMNRAFFLSSSLRETWTARRNRECLRQSLQCLRQSLHCLRQSGNDGGSALRTHHHQQQHGLLNLAVTAARSPSGQCRVRHEQTA